MTKDTERKDRNEEAFKLPEHKDRDYGPYGQQRPERRSAADEDEAETGSASN